MDRSDQELLRHYSKLSKISVDKAKEPYSAELLALCRKDYIDSQGNFVVDSERVIMIEWRGNHLLTLEKKLNDKK